MSLLVFYWLVETPSRIEADSVLIGSSYTILILIMISKESMRSEKREASLVIRIVGQNRGGDVVDPVELYSTRCI